MNHTWAARLTILLTLCLIHAAGADDESPAGSLVERVGAAILAEYEKNAGNEAEACAAIREVAAWLRMKGYGSWVELQQEATR